MNYSIEKEGKLAIFHFKDERLDSTNAHEVKQEVLVLCQDDIDVLIMNLSPVTFCDSTGLGAILLAERQLREHEGGVIVVDTNGKVNNLIRIAKLDQVIPVFATVDEARKAIVED